MGASWIDALGFLNVIDWAEGLLRGIVYGDVTPVRVTLPHPDSFWWDANPEAQYLNLTAVQDLLRSWHVKTFWHGFNGEQIWTHVPNRQARWTEYLLHRAGMIPPVTMQTIDGRNVAWANNARHAGRMPTRWEDRPDSDRRSASKGRRRSTAKRAETWF